MNIIFFGSTADSVTVMDALHRKFPVAAVVTLILKPVGRKKILTATPVEIWSKQHRIPVLNFSQDPEKPWRFAHEEDITKGIAPFTPDLLVTACFGVLIPKDAIAYAKYGGLNVHPSLLPRWRGAYPVPWAILAGDAETGVTIVTLTEKFDDGRMLAQKKIPIEENDIADLLRKKLFHLGAELLVETLPEYLSEKNKGVVQKPKDATIARRLTRDDGFVPWNEFFKALQTNSHDLNRKFRALSGWPGVWTTTPFHKRLKLIAISPSPVVQLEGKKPVEWKIFKHAHLPS